MEQALGRGTSMEPTAPIVSADAPAERESVAHPPDLLLQQYVANEIGMRHKKVITEHVEKCAPCRMMCTRLRLVQCRWRDLKRFAITRFSARRPERKV